MPNDSSPTYKHLHHIRSQQLIALFELSPDDDDLDYYDRADIEIICKKCGSNFNTKTLSDKDLEKIDEMCSKYFDQWYEDEDIDDGGMVD